MIQLSLPWPPSTNHLYATVNGKRVLCAAGRQYKSEVHARVLEQLRHYPRLTGRLAVTLCLNPPDRRVRDIANAEKIVNDSLTAANVWLDDCQIDDLHIIRDVVMSPGRVFVTITEIPMEKAA